MYKNIFIMAVLFTSTLLSIFFVNVYISAGENAINGMSLYHVVMFVILPSILSIYLIFILCKGIHKKQLSKKYGYIYGVFILSIILFYFTIYTSLPNYPYIPESNFETRLQNQDIPESENGLEKMSALSQQSSGLRNLMQETLPDQSKLHNCFITQKDCDNLDVQAALSDSMDFIQKYSEEIEEINTRVEEINSFQYFKYDITSNDFPSIQGYSSLARLSLFQAIYFIENGDEAQALKILYDYTVLGEKLINSDAILIVTLVGISNYNLALENIKYIVNNYEIDTSSDNFLNIRTILAAPILPEEIFSNAIKLEYQLNFQGIKENINSSMLFNTDEYGNILRNGWQRVIDKNIGIYEESSPSIFTREYIYYTFLGKDFISFRGYYEELEKINTIKKEILELIK